VAVQQEIWVNSIIEELYDSNQFLRYMANRSEYVRDGKIIHKPQSGGGSGVEKNRSVFPAGIRTRLDTEIAEVIDEYTSNPVKIPHADTVELSYNKRMSVIREMLGELLEQVGSDTIAASVRDCKAGNKVAATGDTRPATAPGATGPRTTVIGDDVLKCAKVLDLHKVPSRGRVMLLDTQDKHDLMSDEKLKYAFQKTIDLKTGKIGQLYGFDLIDRTLVLRMTAGLAPKDAFTANAADDTSGSIFWQGDHLEYYPGMVRFFENLGDPTLYADVYSMLLRFTGGPKRADGKGYGLLYRAAA
jgi:hypothetical protein